MGATLKIRSLSGPIVDVAPDTDMDAKEWDDLIKAAAETDPEQTLSIPIQKADGTTGGAELTVQEITDAGGYQAAAKKAAEKAAPEPGSKKRHGFARGAAFGKPKSTGDEPVLKIGTPEVNSRVPGDPSVDVGEPVINSRNGQAPDAGPVDSLDQLQIQSAAPGSVRGRMTAALMGAAPSGGVNWGGPNPGVDLNPPPDPGANAAAEHDLWMQSHPSPFGPAPGEGPVLATPPGPNPMAAVVGPPPVDRSVPAALSKDVANRDYDARVAARMKAEAGQQPPPKQVDIPFKQGPGGMMLPPEFGKFPGFAEEQAAIARRAKIAADVAEATAYEKTRQSGIIAQQAALRAQIQNDMQAHMQGLQTAYQKTTDAMNDPKLTVDPGHWWATRNTGQRILAGISILLGSLGQGTKAALGMDTRNQALDMIQNSIRSDIDAQKTNVENKRLQLGQKAEALRGSYAMLREQGLTAAEASAAAEAAGLKEVQAQIDSIVSAGAGDEAKAAAEQVKAQLQQKEAEQLQKAGALRQEGALKAAQTTLANAQAAMYYAKAAGAGAAQQDTLVNSITELQRRFHEGRFGPHDSVQYENLRQNVAYRVAARIHKTTGERMTQPAIDAIVSRILPPWNTLSTANADAAFENAKHTLQEMSGGAASGVPGEEPAPEE